MSDMFSEEFCKDAIKNFRHFIGLPEKEEKKRETEIIESDVIFKRRVNLVPIDAFDEDGFFKNACVDLPLPDATISGRKWFRALMKKHDFEIAIDKLLEIFKSNLEVEKLSHTDIRNLASYIEMQLLLKENYITENEYNSYVGK